MTLEEILKLYELTVTVKALNQARGKNQAFNLKMLDRFFNAPDIPQPAKAALASTISEGINGAVDRSIGDVEREIERITGQPATYVAENDPEPPQPLPRPIYYAHKPGDPPPEDAIRCILIDLLFSNDSELLNVRPIHIDWIEVVGWRPAISGA